VSAASRYRLDDLRRFAAALASGAGLSRADATALAGHLLWYDAAGASAFGLSSLPGWLDRLAKGEVQPRATGRIASEFATAVVIEADRAVGPLVLSQAAGVAVQKARELGTGLARVAGLGACGPAAAVAATAALGPFGALVLGPGPSWTVALPMAGELPFVFDSDLAASAARTSPTCRKDARDGGPPALPTWLAALAPPPGGWLVAAFAVTTLEPLAGFHDRLAAALPREEVPGVLRPDRWEEHRRLVRERGLPLDAATRTALRAHADRLGVPFPGALSS
jgi:LDH2 family malate/lactate/ureidoglycolate dehydrogenase